jgi:hypothetical protein
MATTDRQHYALQTIFSFFLGLMVLAFIGVGVNTFYPSPATQQAKAQQSIDRQIEAINVAAQNKSLDATQQAQIKKLQDERNSLQDVIDSDMKTWARNTSIILIIFATLVMGVSLLLSAQLLVLSNGLLLGGLFTMLYGTGWVIFSGNSTARFFVIAFALVVAIVLGYLKFVRGRAEKTATAEVEPRAREAVTDGGLEARVAALEARAAAAAAALSGTEPTAHEGCRLADCGVELESGIAQEAGRRERTRWTWLSRRACAPRFQFLRSSVNSTESLSTSSSAQSSRPPKMRAAV